MHKSLLSVSLAAALLSSLAVAYAAETTGTIRAIDAVKLTITLDNGKTYALLGSVDAASLSVGEKIKVTFAVVGGKNEASAVTPAK